MPVLPPPPGSVGRVALPPPPLPPPPAPTAARVSLPAPLPPASSAPGALTARTRQLLPDATLRTPLGNSTVHDQLARQVRYRVEGNGPLSTRRLVPDTEITRNLAGTPAGARLDNYLHAVMSEFDGVTDRMSVRGFTFVPDELSAAAMVMLQDAEFGIPSARMDPAFYVEGGRRFATNSAAWHSGSWTSFAPDTSRQILGALGIGRLDPSDPFIQTDTLPMMVTRTAVHELHHAESPQLVVNPATEKLRWLEEGTATLLSDEAKMLTRLTQQVGLSPTAYRSQIDRSLRYGPEVDLGWQPWKRQVMPLPVAQVQQMEVKRNYADSLTVIKRLLHAAGKPVESDFDGARELLQGETLDRVPHRLASAIAERHGLNPQWRDWVAATIPFLNDSAEATDNMLNTAGIKL